MGTGWISSLLVDGIIGGVGSVLVFVPIIFILFLILSILEDCGYLARAAFVMELTVQRAEKVEGTVKAPPSKSYSHRAFILASLSDGRSTVRDALYSEDTLASLETCRALGAEFERKSAGECLINGFGCSPSTPEDVLDVKNSGTTLRIMTSVSALAPGFTVFTGDDSLRQRPMQELLDSLKNLGVNAHSTKNDGKAPLIVEGGFKGGETSIPGNVSSQFVSSILIAGA